MQVSYVTPPTRVAATAGDIYRVRQRCRQPEADGLDAQWRLLQDVSEHWAAALFVMELTYGFLLADKQKERRVTLKDVKATHSIFYKQLYIYIYI